MNQLRAYIEACCRHDIPAAHATLADECVTIESYGAIYLGKPRVEQ
ncbi:hypothetical protein [Kribbella deserti]|uniref:Nuclear transport factor 2 family protein n=1 Tax=Kribbella deserti TaxID=1926257 RepID=A0ABV6QLP5_9ACTN